MKKTIEEVKTIDEFLESQIDTEEGLSWYKDRLVFIQKEMNDKEVNYNIRLLVAQTANIRFPEKSKVH